GRGPPRRGSPRWLGARPALRGEGPARSWGCPGAWAGLWGLGSRRGRPGLTGTAPQLSGCSSDWRVPVSTVTAAGPRAKALPLHDGHVPLPRLPWVGQDIECVEEHEIQAAAGYDCVLDTVGMNSRRIEVVRPIQAAAEVEVPDADLIIVQRVDR